MTTCLDYTIILDKEQLKSIEEKQPRVVLRFDVFPRPPPAPKVSSKPKKRG